MKKQQLLAVGVLIIFLIGSMFCLHRRKTALDSDTSLQNTIEGFATFDDSVHDLFKSLSEENWEERSLGAFLSKLPSCHDLRVSFHEVSDIDGFVPLNEPFGTKVFCLFLEKELACSNFFSNITFWFSSNKSLDEIITQTNGIAALSSISGSTRNDDKQILHYVLEYSSYSEHGYFHEMVLTNHCVISAPL